MSVEAAAAGGKHSSQERRGATAYSTQVQYIYVSEAQEDKQEDKQEEDTHLEERVVSAVQQGVTVLARAAAAVGAGAEGKAVLVEGKQRKEEGRNGS